MDAPSVYQKQMYKRKRGMPLYEPECEVHIGDVGYFSRGRFERLFNITRPDTDPWQTEMGVPTGFEPIKIPEVHRLASPTFLRPQPLRSKYVNFREVNVQLNP